MAAKSSAAALPIIIAAVAAIAATLVIYYSGTHSGSNDNSKGGNNGGDENRNEGEKEDEGVAAVNKDRSESDATPRTANQGHAGDKREPQEDNNINDGNNADTVGDVSESLVVDVEDKVADQHDTKAKGAGNENELPVKSYAQAAAVKNVPPKEDDEPESTATDTAIGEGKVIAAGDTSNILDANVETSLASSDNDIDAPSTATLPTATSADNDAPNLHS